ncbi:MAG TPA: hypothetical protein DCE42_00430 [Myxococcales bacterium]|nr:hypothetical protein [Deltaproteobacteria bacterium]MBU54905.1 hypothetical protein [Deltaproteobacteria bacterium]HAA53185.1 hypothetical protein [Myxococcales bacterium]|tara:strand:+ start:19848 stop:20348 length:501 start_codon:yes stop_codon:yes gene_type:complete
MNKSSMDRRAFLRNSSAAALLFTVPTWVWSTGCGSGPEVVEKNETWEKDAAALEAKGTVLTKEEPGKWSEKVTPHIPAATFNEGANSVDVVVPHPMTTEHWISDVYIKNQDGIVIGYQKWEAKAYEGDEAKAAKATFTLPAGTTMIAMYSYCNLHDHWKVEGTKIG